MPDLAEDTRFRVSSDQAKEIVAAFGTPVYVIDERAFRERITRYRDTLCRSHPNSSLSYASKANSALTLLRIAHREGCLIDVASEGELRAALAAGIPASDCYLHGNNKSRKELLFALESEIGEIVVDNFEEIEQLVELKTSHALPRLLLRLAPGVDPITHERIATGQEDTKFGINISDGSAERALLLCLKHGLPVIGFHAHVGSQLLDPEAQCVSGEVLADFAAKMLKAHGFRTEVINVGGGLGVKYVEGQEPLPIEGYVERITESVAKGLGDSGLDIRLIHEPGRALICDACVTLYQVGVVKTVPIGEGQARTYVCVDGGLADNPRPALYDAQYTVERVIPPAYGWHYEVDGPGAAFSGGAGSVTVTVSGRHCETDTLFKNVELPTDIKAGDILQVLCTGAYNGSMASNYNRYSRPATILIDLKGEFHVIQRPDTWDEQFAREIIPEAYR